MLILGIYGVGQGQYIHDFSAIFSLDTRSADITHIIPMNVILENELNKIYLYYCMLNKLDRFLLLRCN